MTRNYYQILEVSETSTQEEIKKSYRKLALKWHPDKNTNNKEEAEKKFKEIGEAYGILSNEDLRKRYDAGETNFTSDFAGSTCEAEMEDIKEKIRRKQEEINIMKDMLANEEEREKIMEEMWLLNAEYIDRDGTYIEISAAMGFNMPRVFKKDLEENGYSHLWEPYQDWLDKVWKMPITLKRKVKEESDELKKFKGEMFKAIKETGVIIENKEKAKKKARTDASLERDRVNAIEAIERELRERGLEAQDLGGYSNYEEQINNLDKQWKIRSLRDKIKQNIYELGNKKDRFVPKYDDNKDKIEINKLKELINQFSSSENDKEWKKEKSALEKQIQELKAQKNQEKLNKKVSQLEEITQQLEKEIQELKTEIQEIKKENDNSPEYRSYLTQKENQLKDKQSKLERLKGIVKGSGFESQEPKSENDFLTYLVPGAIALILVVVMGAILVSKKKNREK